MSRSAGGKAVISAGEINKFTYCPRQWYYIRMYGQKRLREMYHAANPGKEHPSTPGFKRGQAFHRGYGRRGAIKRLAPLIAILAAMVLLVFILKAAGII